MPRIDKTRFTFTIVGGSLSLSIQHPALMPHHVGYDDTAIAAVLTAGQKTALSNLLAAFFARAEADIKAVIQAQRNALDSDP